MNWYFEVLKKYAVFSGRARRKEFWMFKLFDIIILFITLFLDNLLGTVFISGIYNLAVFIPSLAVLVRRLHDTNKTGWWILIAFVPIIGIIVLLIFLVTVGNHDRNDYGESPKKIQMDHSSFV